MAVEEFLAALEDHEVGSPQPGDRVRGSDHGEARRGPRRGEVERLYRARPVELGGHPRLAGAYSERGLQVRTPSVLDRPDACAICVNLRETQRLRGPACARTHRPLRDNAPVRAATTASTC